MGVIIINIKKIICKTPKKKKNQDFCNDLQTKKNYLKTVFVCYFLINKKKKKACLINNSTMNFENCLSLLYVLKEIVTHAHFKYFITDDLKKKCIEIFEDDC